MLPADRNSKTMLFDPALAAPVLCKLCMLFVNGSVSCGGMAMVSCNLC